MASFTLMRTYALLDPSEVPNAVKLCSTDFSVTVHDRFPKAHFHNLVLPRTLPPLTPENLRDLRSLLLLPREQAKAVLLGLRRDALAVRALIQEEMVKRYGFAWDVLMGFHALPSVEYVVLPLKHITHLHLHVISSDFLGDWFKGKKHANSFHPRLGFFISIDEVIRWYDPDIEPTWFAMKAAIDKKEYQEILRRDMLCPHCDAPYKTVKKMKQHLQEVFDKMKEEALQRQFREAIAAAGQAASSAEGAPAGEVLAVEGAAVEGAAEAGAGAGAPAADAAQASAADAQAASGVVAEEVLGEAGAGQPANESGDNTNSLKRKHVDRDDPSVTEGDAADASPPGAKRAHVEAAPGS